MGKDINFKSGYGTASNCFDSNLKLVIGTFASGIGVNNIAQLISFLDIPNIKSRHDFF